MIELDGSRGEGGGQIVRTAIGLSAVTGRPVKIYNIRAGRENPGLRPQHIKGIEAAAKICNAMVMGLKEGSPKLEFVPGKLEGGRLRVDVGTAGSISLVLQTLLIPAIHTQKGVKVLITGGTDVNWSPSMDYFQNVFCDYLSRIGIKTEIETLRRGFYPKGGGKVVFSVKPCYAPNPLELVNRGDLERVDIWSIASNKLKKARVAERQIDGAEEILGDDTFSHKNVRYGTSSGPGSSVHMHAHYENCKLGAGGIGEVGEKSEAVGKEAGIAMKRQMDSNACLDEWMGDQIIPYLALASPYGKSTVSVSSLTNHTNTNVWVTEKFLPIKFKKRKNIIKVSK